MTQQTKIPFLRHGAAYIRVSTNMQEELSPDAQKRLILDFAQQNQILLEEELIFMEKGISGRKADKRPEFLRMIATAKSGEHPIDVILVWKFSRFARNQEESIVYKSLLKKQCEVDVISVSEPIIEGPFGSLIERIIEWMDEYYSTRLSGEVFRGMSEKALRGGYQARPPLGYQITVKNEPPVIVPREAQIIRLIFHQYAIEGKSIFSIAKYLNSLGLKTSHGNDFEKRSLEYILRNPTYIGKIRWNRTESTTNRIKDPDEWIVEDGQHEAIIEEDLFCKAQQRFQAEHHLRGSKPSSISRHWLSGLLKCSSCGRTLSSSKQTRNGRIYYSFQCCGYLKGKCSTSHSISAAKAEAAVLEILKRDLSIHSLIFKPQDTSMTPDSTIQLLKSQIEKIKQKEARIKKSYSNGVDTLEEYKINKELLQIEQKELLSQINSIQLAAVKDEEKILRHSKDPNLTCVCDMIASDNFTIQQKNEALRCIIFKIVFDKGEDSLQIYYNFTNTFV